MNTNRSVLGNHWCYLEPNQDLRHSLVNHYGIDGTLSYLLANKDHVNEKNFDAFLLPKLKNHLPDPYIFKDMALAVERVIRAIQQKEKVIIFADYDVDGATSSAALKIFLRNIGFNVDIYIPDRVTEGYGPNIQAFTKLKQMGYSLAITVDCGTVAFEPIEVAKQIGLDVLVIDHHIGSHQNPKSIAVINPNRYDENNEYGYLCAAGVVFVFCTALAKNLKQEYAESSLKTSLVEILDLVAMGTVCDVVPLVGLNRAIVKQGLETIKQTKNIGLQTLIKHLNLDSNINTGNLGFHLGPVINAGGRIGKPHYGATLLSTTDHHEAQNISSTLIELNLKRREMESEAVEEAMESLSSVPSTCKYIFEFSENWHQGIVGIVASRIKDKHNKPTMIGSLVLQDDGTKIIKASCRSINNINIGDIIIEATKKNILIKGGGHAMAAGFSLDYEKLDQFYEFLSQAFEDVSEDTINKRVINVDMCIAPDAINESICHHLQQLEPFGCQNQQPNFVIKDVVVVGSKIIKDAHIKFTFKSKYGGARFDAISFRSIGSDMEMLLNQGSRTVDILCKIDVQWFANKYRPSVVIQDAWINLESA